MKEHAHKSQAAAKGAKPSVERSGTHLLWRPGTSSLSPAEGNPK